MSINIIYMLKQSKKDQGMQRTKVMLLGKAADIKVNVTCFIKDAMNF